MASDFDFPRRERVPADMVAYPHLVKDGIVERISISIGPRPIAQIGTGCSLVIHPEPFDADGALSAACRAFLLSSVQKVAQHFASPIYIVWSAASCSFVETDGSIIYSTGVLTQ